MSKRIDVFQDVLKEFESEEIKNFCIDILENAPQSFWSKETKYYDFAGGLVTQAIIGAMSCNDFLTDKNYREAIDKPKKRDCIRTAAILRYIYPSVIVETRGIEHDIKKGLREYIANLIKDYRMLDGIEHKIVLMSDVKSREACESPISKKTQDLIKEVALPDPKDYFFPANSEKFANMNFWLVYEMDKDYLKWLKDSIQYLHIQEPLRSYLREYV